MNDIEPVTPAPAPFTSYSLNFEDVILHRLFPDQERGFYVDVGAGHPRFENDLYAFYRRGWQGINIEPNEGFFALLQEKRPRDRNLMLALSDVSGEPLVYHEFEGSGLSTCDAAQAHGHEARGYRARVRSVPVRTLADVLEEAGAPHIDILKVDVEGLEEQVLAGNDWDRFRPSVVLVEATYPESPRRRPTNIGRHMEQRGYRHVLFDGLNDFYLEQSVVAPEGLALPPNVFDRFITRDSSDLNAQIRSLQDSFATLQASFGSAERYAMSLSAQLEEALQAVGGLAEENRRLGAESGRLAAAAVQMRGEILTLTQMLEPLHGLQEVREREQATAGQLRATAAQLHATEAKLREVYGSRSWWLTKPWRFAGRLAKRILR